MSTGEPKTSIVELEKGTTGLGFNIVGGNDKPYILGDFGIFISSIKPDGVASRDGRMKVGDRIVAVNDIDITNVPHDSAVATFRSAKGRVKLEVEYEAERRILEKPSRILADLPFKPLQLNSTANTSPKVVVEEKILTLTSPDPTPDSKETEAVTNSVAKKIPILVTPEKPGENSLRQRAAAAGDTVDTPSVSAAVSQANLLIDDIPKTPKNGSSGNYSFPIRPPLRETVATLVGAAAIVALGIFIYRRYRQQ